MLACFTLKFDIFGIFLLCVLSFFLRTLTDCSPQKVECNFQLIMEVNAENNFEFVCIGPLRKLRHISNYHIEITTALKKILISFERKLNKVFLVLKYVFICAPLVGCKHQADSKLQPTYVGGYRA